MTSMYVHRLYKAEDFSPQPDDSVWHLIVKNRAHNSYYRISPSKPLLYPIHVGTMHVRIVTAITLGLATLVNSFEPVRYACCSDTYMHIHTERS